MTNFNYNNYEVAQCLPIESLLLAVNRSKVDFFSLDVEGIEMDFLKVFPFNEIHVDVWVIESMSIYKEPNVSIDSLKDKNDWSLKAEDIRHHGGDFTEDIKLVEFMEKNGYYFFDMHCNVLSDFVFIRIESDLFKKLEVPKDKMKRRNLCDKRKILIGFKQKRYLTENEFRDHTHWPDLRYKLI